MADTRSLQRKVNRLTLIETYAKGDLSQEPIERIKAQVKLLTEEWADYKTNEKNFRELPENIDLQDVIETKYFAIKGKLVQAELASEKDIRHGDLDSSLHELMVNQRSFLNEVTNLNVKGDSDVRLPRVNVPTFSGIYSEFASFRDLFEASIHSNPKITKVHKLQYLKGLLRGEAAALVRHITITEANYDEAWEIINNRYDKKKHVTAMLLKQFMDQPTIKQASAKSLHHMRDVSDEVLRGLKVLGKQAESRDPWLIHILVNKLDQTTKHDWAQNSYGIEFPTINNFFDFLNKQSDTLESCQPSRNVTPQLIQHSNLKVMHADTQSVTCLKCGANHYLRNCEQFLQLSVHDRRSFVADNKLCFICMFQNHQSQKCRSRFSCGICRAKHHTTLHQDMHKTPPSTTILTTEAIPSASTSGKADTDSLSVAHAITTKQFTALLPTAVIRVLDSSNQYQRCRVLLDSGAQASFISESCAQRLALTRKNAKILIKGLTPGTDSTRGVLSIQAVSLYSSAETVQIDVLVLQKLTSCLPSCEINTSNLQKIQALKLADPYFHTPGAVDIIIGADRFFNVLREGRVDNLEDNLIAQNSMFGWILSGEATKKLPGYCPMSVNCHIGSNVDETLRKFWEMEEIPACNPFSKEESDCEDHFMTNVQRYVNGKYVVKLPFKTSSSTLGDSLMIARKRYFNLEQKLNRDAAFKSEYAKVIREYITLGHLKEIPNPTTSYQEGTTYYLPHHAVIKSESTTTNLRVVFDGSSKTSNGTSINDLLMVGPTIQPTLWITLLNFRYGKIALTADIEKMYRQVMVADMDQDFQRILWRENVSDPLKHYKLTTVTFGMASSAFLAIRSLQQAAHDFQQEYPVISNEILSKFYIDDYISGADTLEEAKNLKHQLTDILSLRGFNLRKWKSNAKELLKQPIDGETSMVPFEEANSTTKILGLQWNPKDDELSFKVNLPEESTPTKRSLISNASKVFDPLGLLSPSIVLAKILYQKLWLRKLDWDDKLPDDIAIVWNQLKAELPQFEQLKIKRHINKKEMQIHGFCDASERAYSAVVYSRFKDENGEMRIELVTSKTKVAPIRQVSLPRLELCGAHLLSKLLKEVKKTLSEDVPVYSWTDSTIVLAWLSDHPTKWKTFVANRVSEIQQLLPRNHWNHVKSDSNPADYASRGVLPSKLLTIQQWWHGPPWLNQPEHLWPLTKQQVFYDDTICEKKKTTSSISLLTTKSQIAENDIFQIILDKTFSFTKAVRILSYIYRFIENVRKAKGNRQTTAINLREINQATEKLLRWVQRKEYPSEISMLEKGQMLAKNHKLSSLTPFLDVNGLLRVGGRLENSLQPYDVKHPIILPKYHILSRMIISVYHKKYLHPGPSHTSHLIRQAYWIVNGRATVRDEVRKCINCFKNRAKTAKQLMGNLPSVRVTPARPFSSCGVDYAGPIFLATKRGRGAKLVKGYIAVFVCMVTKAVHIEAVTELTADAFIAALKRFSSRRNVPSDIYADNGTNFIGASRQLKEVYQFNNRKINDKIISEFCTTNQINWHHIPPSAPHFGGLWESAVKSVKTHLNRVTGNCHLTFEEMATLLCQIEGILNSRPLCPVSEDDDSFEALTPAHFLMGSTIAAVPENDLGDITQSRLSRWQQVEQRAQSFWKRFHKDYLNNLQQRTKWKNQEENIKVGDLVLIKEDNLPSCKWATGRILQEHPDTKGLTRVVTIKTASNTLKRPITKICKLPLN